MPAPFIELFGKRPAVKYIPDKIPTIEKGVITFRRAPEISWTTAERMWLWRNWMVRDIDRFDAQILILPTEDVLPKEEGIGISAPNSFYSYTQNLIEEQIPLGQYPPAIPFERNHPDKNPYMELNEVNPNAKSIYVVASLRNTADLIRLELIGDFFQGCLKKPVLTAVITGAGFTREDKNIKDNILTARMAMRNLAQYFDRAFIVEPHSSATQAFAAKFGLPVASISPNLYMLENLQSEGLITDYRGNKIEVNNENFVEIRPDEGRNIASSRIQDEYGLQAVSFKKKRIDARTVIYEPLDADDQRKLYGKFGLTYDDEGSTFGTMGRLSAETKKYGCLGMIALVALLKLTDCWEDNIGAAGLKDVFYTDAIVPLGNPNLTSKLHRIPLSPFLEQIIDADMNGVNFWRHPYWSKLILQPRPGSNEK